ncbi:nucleotidyltransferase domain-containing protein [Lysinibacillus sp. NPDC092081]|uniref:nucleotidyltransferase domain-containing protein n=1 Tax=Lysinibacillus sp. NPDC092081 TaxID=3364131 RepID=UPI0037F1585F
MNLKSLASEISKIYMQNSKVEAVLLGGSISRNWHDEYSDIELFIFWKDSPTEEVRQASIKTVNGSSK